MSKHNTYRITFSHSAEKQFDNLPENIKKRVASILEIISETPRPSGVEKLSGFTNYYRVRAGNYRVVYSIEDDRLIILIIRIAHRKDVYRKL